MSCLSIANCSYNGWCSGGECLCHPAFTGEQCQFGLLNTLGPVIWLYGYGLGSVFAILAVVSLYYYIPIIKKKEKDTAVNIIKAIWTLLVFVTIERSVYLFFDPHRVREISSFLLDAILYGIGVWGVIAMYVLINSLWIEINIMMKQRKCFVVVKYVAFASIAVLLVVELTQDIYRPEASDTIRNALYTAYYVYLFVTIVVLVLGFLIFGRAVQRASKLFLTNVTWFKKIHQLLIIANLLALLSVGGIILAYVFRHIATEKSTSPYIQLVAFIATQATFRIVEACYCLLVLITLRIKHEDPNVAKNDKENLIKNETISDYQLCRDDQLT